MAEQTGRQSIGKRKDDNTALDVVAIGAAGLGVLVGGLGLVGLVLTLCTRALSGIGLTLVNVAVPALAFGYALLDAAPRGSSRRHAGTGWSGDDCARGVPNAAVMTLRPTPSCTCPRRWSVWAAMGMGRVVC